MSRFSGFARLDREHPEGMQYKRNVPYREVRRSVGSAPPLGAFYFAVQS